MKLLLWTLLSIASYTTFRADALADSVPSRGYKVCTSSPCKPNGSGLLLDALESISNSDQVAIKEDYCLAGCCSGVVVKPLGTSGRRVACKVIADEKTALQVAEELLLQINGDGSADESFVDEDKLSRLKDKITAGERALEKSDVPEICHNCGVGLQLYRGNCAKCGKYPY